ncbi:unnamed protein product [Meloidogyne enterolobii]|uniref:Uncharacterized protein n=1 Tax=Meloidogyne enterolobii TaxID=390850 RepID=A0ACB0YGC9_MELEN
MLSFLLSSLLWMLMFRAASLSSENVNILLFGELCGFRLIYLIMGDSDLDFSLVRASILSAQLSICVPRVANPVFTSSASLLKFTEF